MGNLNENTAFRVYVRLVKMMYLEDKQMGV